MIATAGVFDLRARAARLNTRSNVFLYVALEPGHVGVTHLAPNPLNLSPRPHRALAPTELHAPRRPKRPLQPGARTSPLQMLPDAVAGDWQVVASRVDVLILAVDPEWGERVSGDVG